MNPRVHLLALACVLGVAFAGCSTSSAAPGCVLGVVCTGTTNPPHATSSAATSPTASPTAPASTGSPTTTPPAPPSGVLKVHYVNVGQGDGTIWELPGGGTVVFDCGPAAGSSAANPMATYLRATLGLAAGSHIHALVASHGHLDHIGGCQEIFQDYVVENVYDTWYTGTDAPQSYQAFRDQVRAEGAVLHDLADDPAIAGDVQFRKGDALALPASATAAGASAQILWPAGAAPSWGNIADSSIVVHLTLGSVDYCFQGDVESPQEASLAGAAGIDCEIYLMGHHGSKYASSAGWLGKLHPKLAPVSFGANGYGHPTPEALCRVQQAGAKVYATHRLGAIVIQTDGTATTVTPDQPETKDYCASGASYW
ncbi:MAG TPA: MBL fold metallo-hydrolase [Candidatus Thermoplasmatota archaeon]|nr:MBL fold metallo-hydrolase [Candidatus Thermoplasmatota archaeon]